jgi:hypothetical protein
LLVTGSVVMTVGLGLLATMGVATGQLTTSLYMVVLGVGMGMLMQTTMLVVQNSVDRRDIGAASGASTLFRTIGGSLGVSLLGAVFAQRLERGMDGQVGAGQITGGAQVTPAMLGQLPAAVREAYQQAITSGVHQVFLWGAAIAVVAVVAAWFIHEVPLRGTSTEHALEA